MKNQKKIKDRDLIARLRKGDKKAVRWWFKQYKPYLLKIALSKVKLRQDAEELVQETFINCLKSLSSFEFNSTVKTWMIRILYHEIADYYRKKYAKKTIQTLPLGELIIGEKFFDSHQISQNVRKTLSYMLSEKRELLKLKYVDKLKVKQIAKKMGRSVKAIESELFRARKEFRELYLVVEKRMLKYS